MPILSNFPENSAIYGQKRHLFGGIAPSNMKKFTVDDIIPQGIIAITAILPDDTVIDGQTLCTVEGAVIRRKKGEYPKDEFDGELVEDIKESRVFDADDGYRDAIDEGGYYYAAFPYSTQGVYNRSSTNRARYSEHYLYGYDLNLNDPNPSTRVIYPDDVDNRSYQSAKMNFGGSFDYGDWPSQGGVDFMPRPCLLRDGTTSFLYLNDDNYLQTESYQDSNVDDMSLYGNAMMQWPKIYTKRWEEDDVYHFRCSDIKIDEDYECWCNYNKNNKEIKYFYTPIYNGVKETIHIDDETEYGYDIYKLRSISGQTTTVFKAADAMEYANLNAAGLGYCIETLADRLLINDLLTMMGKSTDLQSVYGHGYCDRDNESKLKTGTMDDKGLFWGSDDGTSGVKVFGMENYWGNIPRRIAGWVLKNGVSYLKYTIGTKDGSTAEGYNTDGEGYIQRDDITMTGHTLSGYVSKCKTTPIGRVPCDARGSTTTYECSYAFSNTTSLSIPIIGSRYNEDGNGKGPWTVRCNIGVDVTTHASAALSCKPSR